MILFTSFLIGMQIVHTLAASTAPFFDYPSCNSFWIKATAEAALDQINSNRKDGYVLGLQRIFDYNEVPKGDETPYELLLDVLETNCHVRSRKPWKECEFRKPHETVFGPCTILIKFNWTTKEYVLDSYNCFLRPLYTPACPGCPICQDPSEDSIQEIAKECLDKFNEKTNTNKYFAIVEVTKASSQVINGILMTVEFIIQETSCTKSQSEITQCPLIPSETAEAALCKGIVIKRWGSFPNSVHVECDFFPRWLSANAIPKQGTVVQVTGCPWRNREYDRMFPSPEKETNTTIASNPRGYSISLGCPGMVAKEIPGLHLPSYSWQKGGFS